jgi:hypothetical protein
VHGGYQHVCGEEEPRFTDIYAQVAAEVAKL